MIKTSFNSLGGGLYLGNDYIVERFVDGNRWYTRYKSGWIEQGNRESITVSNYIGLCYFVIPFTKLNYSFVITGKSRDTTGYYMDNINIGPSENFTSLKRIQLSVEQNAPTLVSWIACGF